MKKIKEVTPEQKALGARIKAACKSRGFTREKLVDIGIYKNPESVSTVWQGKQQLPSDKLEKLSKVLNVRVDYLRGEDNFETEAELSNEIVYAGNYGFHTAMEYLSSIGLRIEPCLCWVVNDIEIIKENYDSMKEYMKDVSLCYVQSLIKDSECEVDFSAPHWKRIIDENPRNAERFKSFIGKDKRDYYSEPHRIYIELKEVPKGYKRDIDAIRQAMNKWDCVLPFAENVSDNKSDCNLMITTVFKMYYCCNFIGYNFGGNLPDFFNALDSLSDTLFKAFFSAHACTEPLRTWTDIMTTSSSSSEE